jgi:hypothetical protein
MLSLSAPQGIFLNGLNTKFRAFVGGFGSGKTFVGCLDLLTFAARHPKTVQGYFGPSYPAIRDIFYPTFEEASEMMGFTVDIKVSNKEIDIYRGRVYYGTVICRSMDKPQTIIGFKVARALVDEIDTLPKDKAKNAWIKIIARLRLKIDGVVNSIGVTTTPEGFMFVYEQFAKDPLASYSMVQASSYENEDYLPPDYIDSLIETYPNELVLAYVGGKFVNLKAGTVFNRYDRIKHRSSETIRPITPEQPGELLRIGMDFNVTKMSAVIYVIRSGNWHAVDELKGIYDTPAMIATIKNRYPSHSIRVYPDASGNSRKTNDASTSDIALLEAARFAVYANASNPYVKDRVIATNSAFDHGKLFINDAKCPEYASNMEQLSYDKNGEPDKKSNIDHLPDAGTYPIAFEMPVIKPVANLRVTLAR